MKKNDVFTFTAPNGVKVIGVVDKIEHMSNSEDQCQAAINQLFVTGKVTMIDEY